MTWGWPRRPRRRNGLCNRCYQIERRRGAVDKATEAAEVVPCDLCGTTGGRDVFGSGKPTRWSGRRFDLEGWVCDACKVEVVEERRWQTLAAREALARAGRYTFTDGRESCRAPRAHQALTVLGGRFGLDDLTPRAVCRLIRRGMRGGPAPGLPRLLMLEPRGRNWRGLR